MPEPTLQQQRDNLDIVLAATLTLASEVARLNPRFLERHEGEQRENWIIRIALSLIEAYAQEFFSPAGDRTQYELELMASMGRLNTRRVTLGY